MWILQTCAESTADNSNFVKWGIRVNLGYTSFMENSVFTESGGSNEVVNRLSIFGEPCFAITEHHSSVSVDPEKLTQVALFRLAIGAFTTLPSEYWESMVTWFQMCHTLAHALHNPSSFINTIANIFF